MTPRFTTALCDAVLADRPLEASDRDTLVRAIADTMAVAAAAAGSPLIDAAASAIKPASPATIRSWHGRPCADGGDAVFLNGVAAHALDFDDLHVASGAHLSAVLVAALLSDEIADLEVVLAAMKGGFVAAHAIARRLGPGHYRRGWHATSTIGIFGAVAALARLRGLDADRLRHAMGIAASQAGGLRVNFGTDAKALHVGFAAAAARRSVALAEAGMTAADDPFEHAFLDLYGGGDGAVVDHFDANLSSLAVKLYPCCFAAHRLIAAALHAKAAGWSLAVANGARVRIRVPAGSVDVLRYTVPTTVGEALFSGPFAVAVALLDGPPTLDHFTAETVARTDVRAAMTRIEVIDDPIGVADGRIDTGVVRLDILTGGDLLASFEQRAMPGSAEDEGVVPVLRAKIAACLMRFEQRIGTPFPPLAALVRHGAVAAWMRP